MTTIRFLVLFFAMSISGVLSFEAPTLTKTTTWQDVDLRSALRMSSNADSHSPKKKRKCDPCENPFESPGDEASKELDRREATFAMLGSAWAIGLVPTSMLFPSPADAAQGAEANLKLPNPLEGLNDRATKQCLVESLGNRECLLYADDGPKIYQGADSKLLLERVEKASQYLATLPELIESKKWSKVNGVLTGPLGELIKSMNQLAELSNNGENARQKIKSVKNDLYAINAAIVQKDITKALSCHTAATNDLVAFLKAL